MKIRSEERSTGRGAVRFAALLVNGEFVRVSDLDNALYKGRESGVEIYEVEAPDNTVWAEFYRSNSGKENVEVYRGAEMIEEFGSFDAVRAASV